MGLSDKIKELADLKGVTFAEIEREVGISNGQIRRWNNVSPKAETVQKVADYLGVSLDYLLGRERKYWELTEKDERNIQEQLEDMIEDLSTVGLFSKDGEELDDNTRELLIMSLENSLRIASQEAKRKFTPKKYRN